MSDKSTQAPQYGSDTDNDLLYKIAVRLHNWLFGGAAAAVSLSSTVNPTPPVVSTYSPTLFKNLGANATLNVKVSAGNVFSLTCHNENAAERYVQLHDTATVPATGVTVPVFSFLVPTLAQVVIGTDFFTNAGCHFATGIAFAFSTTKDVYTAATAADHSTWVQFK